MFCFKIHLQGLCLVSSYFHCLTGSYQSLPIPCHISITWIFSCKETKTLVLTGDYITDVTLLKSMTEFFLELMSLLYHAACTGGMTSVCSFTGELYGWKTILERDHFHFYIKPCQCECHRKTEIAEEYRFVSYSINHLLDLHPGDLAS